ncbi:MAG: hypothetical protein H7Z13_13290 [Ferruginibacter sp.]|nr:hypothetical protein [Ferruginibacter sp.]
MKKYLLAFAGFVFSLIQPGLSQSLRQPVSAIYLGLGCYSTKHSDVFSFVNNQAALAQIKKKAAGVYGERRFLLAATSLYTAAITVPSAMGNFGLNLKYAGFKNFNEKQIGLAYARSLGPKMDIGVQFNYYGYQVPSFINANTINFEIGAMVHLTGELNAGIHIYNPVGGKFAKTGEQLTAAYKMGLGYDASEIFFVSAEVVKEEDHPVNVNAGFQYQFMKQFFARAGISSASSAAYAGVGISWNNLRLDISGSYHPQLGWSPGLLLVVAPGP